jgi:hypothetical protein
LAPGELKLGTAKCFNGVVRVDISATDGHNLITNVDTSDLLEGLSVRSTHTGRQTIGSGTGKHLVLTHDVIRVATGTDVVTFLSGCLGEVLVGLHTGRLKGASGQLLLLVGHEVDDEGEHIDGGSLGTAIKNSDLGVRDTTAEPGLDVHLVLLEACATRRSCGNEEGAKGNKVKNEELETCMEKSEGEGIVTLDEVVWGENDTPWGLNVGSVG